MYSDCTPVEPRRQVPRRDARARRPYLRCVPRCVTRRYTGHDLQGAIFLALA
jgi:hypothetical protein